MKYLCIHGHFYQPPRENPWLDIIEVQDSAAPHHDWNARITAECYWPNAAAHRLGADSRIVAITNNYASMSFNFGPTLTAWLERHEPELLSLIVEADRVSCEKHSGYGNAIAQAYGHAILPLANPRDKLTHIAWGVRDFVYRFGRLPHGMWLPETAVDTSTLEALAAQNIAYTILAPHQAKRVRRLGHTAWECVNEETLNTRRPYLCHLPSGKQIVLFFYDARIARGVAFEHLLDSGERFVERLGDAFQSDTDEPQLIHLATDGETYGHHHRFGEMAYAFAVHEIERRGLARVTNYGEYLALHPPQWEVEIVESTSWSCAHGVERWRADCGCRTGSLPGWTQQWRAPLRAALDWLRAEIDVLFERQAGAFLPDPWAARDAYIDVILDRSPSCVDEFCLQQARRVLTSAEQQSVLKLLELQRHRLLMFTSCGWFFDELSGLEGTQILRYAARAIEMAKDIGTSLEAEFVERLRRAPSNLSEVGDGGHLYLSTVRPSRIDAPHVVANLAMGQILEPKLLHEAPPAFTVQRHDYEEESYGATAFGVGRMQAASRFTQERRTFVFAALKFSAHDVHCVVREDMVEVDYLAIKTTLIETFARHSLSEVVRSLDRTFGESYYTAKDLFLDDRRRVLAQIGEGMLERLEETYRQLYRENRRLMEYLHELNVPLPQGFALAAEFLVNRTFSRAIASVIEKEQSDDEVEEVLQEARKWQVPLATKESEHLVCRAIEGHIAALLSDPLRNGAALASRLLHVAEHIHLRLNLWRAQTLFVQVCHKHLHDLLQRRSDNKDVARQLTTLRRLGEQLNFAAVEDVPLETWDAS
jgi:alpha-amylase/alpha-mannosidase (GH57 family)